MQLTSTNPRFFAHYQRFDLGTKSKINWGWKKCIFAMANLQNYKRVKIRMDDMISQQFFRLPNLCYVYNIWNFGMVIKPLIYSSKHQFGTSACQNKKCRVCPLTSRTNPIGFRTIQMGCLLGFSKPLALTYFWSLDPLYSIPFIHLALPLPLSVPLTAEVVMAKVITACAMASEFWSKTSKLMLSKVSQARW